MWHELLRPFNGVKRLRVIGGQLAIDLSCALDADDAGLIPWLLPELQELDLNGAYPREETAFVAFINARQSVGRPVNLLPPPPAASAVGATNAVRPGIRQVPYHPPRQWYPPPPLPSPPLPPSPPFPLLSLPAQTNRS
jgi:hypothetical protein